MSLPVRINPASLYSDAPYDYAVIAPAGGLVFTAGACPIDVEGRVKAVGNFVEQTRQALENLTVVLTAAGSGLHRVLKTTVYVVTADRPDLTLVWTVVQEWFAPARPASTLLGVSVLGYPNQLVEIEAVAVRA
jgi:enamine deaminase RidA (YjgF/YER057c/UK114 family)